MAYCIDCGSTNLGELEYDPECEGCCLMECEDCGAQFDQAELVGVDHDDSCDMGAGA